MRQLLSFFCWKRPFGPKDLGMEEVQHLLQGANKMAFSFRKDERVYQMFSEVLINNNSLVRSLSAARNVTSFLESFASNNLPWPRKYNR